MILLLKAIGCAILALVLLALVVAGITASSLIHPLMPLAIIGVFLFATAIFCFYMAMKEY